MNPSEPPPDQGNSSSAIPTISGLSGAVVVPDVSPSVPSQPPVAPLSRQNASQSSAVAPTRFSPNCEERLFIHQTLHDSQFWLAPKKRQDAKFESIIKHVSETVDNPMRPHTRTGLTTKYIKTLIKNMPRYVVDKRNRFEQKRSALSAEGEQLSDEDLEVSLSRAEVCDLRMLRLAETIVTGIQSQINTTDENDEEVAASAAASRKRRDDRRNNSQEEYAKRKKKARRAEADRENRFRLSEHRNERLMTASVNDGRHMARLLGGLVHIFGKQAGMTDGQLHDMLGSTAEGGEPLQDPPEPDLVQISSDEGSDGNENVEESQAEPDNDNDEEQEMEE